MNTEVEAKFLGTDHDELREKLERLGARQERPMRSMRQVVMDFPDSRLKESRKSWLRIRDEGYTVRMTYKQLDNWAPSGVRMVEVIVAGFDAAKNVLEAVGMEAKAYHEARHETWHLGDVRVVLTEWPHVRPFTELECEDEAEVRRAAVSLGLEWEDAVFGSIEPVYIAEYDINAADFHRINDMTFSTPIPQLLKDNERAEPITPTKELVR